MNVVFYSETKRYSYCFARLVNETCSASAADINMLKAIYYDRSRSSPRRCPLGMKYTEITQSEQILRVLHLRDICTLLMTFLPIIVSRRSLNHSRISCPN